MTVPTPKADTQLRVIVCYKVNICKYIIQLHLFTCRYNIYMIDTIISYEKYTTDMLIAQLYNKLEFIRVHKFKSTVV